MGRQHAQQRLSSQKHLTALSVSQKCKTANNVGESRRSRAKSDSVEAGQVRAYRTKTRADITNKYHIIRVIPRVDEKWAGGEKKGKITHSCTWEYFGTICFKKHANGCLRLLGTGSVCFSQFSSQRSRTAVVHYLAHIEPKSSNLPH